MPTIDRETLDQVERALAKVSLRLTAAKQTGWLNSSWSDEERECAEALSALRAARKAMDAKDG